MEKLEFDGNKLQTNFLRDMSIQYLKRLRVLDLSRTNQTELYTKDLEWNLPSLRSLKFSENPIECECDQQKEIVVPETLKLYQPELIKCQNDRFINTPVLALEDFDFAYCEGKISAVLVAPSP